MTDFPNLGVDPNQIALVASAFAAQANIFDNLAGLGGNGLGAIAKLFGLIGFVYIGLFHTAWRAIVIGPWLVLLIIMNLGTDYTGGNVVFVKIDISKNQSMSTPVSQMGAYTAEELREIKEEGGDLAYYIKKLRTAEDTVTPPKDPNASRDIHMFGPQVGILHALNVLHRDLANAIFSPGKKALKGRLAAVQTLQSARTDDFRVAHMQALFRSSCHDPSSLFAVPPGTIEDEHTPQNIAWEREKITFLDFILMHDLFYNNQRKLSDRVEEDNDTLGSFISPALMTNDSVRRVCAAAQGIDLSAPRPSGGAGQMGRDRGPRGPSDDACQSGPLAGLETYAGTDETSGDVDPKFKDFANAGTRTEKERNFQQFMEVVSEDPDNKDVLDTKIEVILPVREGGKTGGNSVSTLASWFGQSKAISSCKGFHTYLHNVTADLADETLGISSTAAEFAEKQFKECQKGGGDAEGCAAFRDREKTSFSGLSELEKVRMAIAYAERAINEGCNKQQATRSRKDCEDVTQTELDQLYNGLTSNVLKNERVVSDGILENAMSSNQFRGPIRRLAYEGGEALAGPFVWLMSLFGGFAAGTYAAIMPMVVAWGLAIMIAVTPFIYLMGLIIPAWSLMIFLTPLIGVLYLKSVEIVFVLIKGVFEIFRTIIGPDILSSGYVTGTDAATEQFYDMILGIAYVSSFAITLFLLFGLKNPASMAEKVGSSADKTSQISGQEALAMAGTAAVAAKYGPKAAALVGSAGSGVGKFAASAESSGIMNSETAANVASHGGQRGQIARGEALSSKAEQEAKANSMSALSHEDFQSRAAGKMAKQVEEEQNQSIQANGNGDLLSQPPPGLTEVNGQVLQTDKLKAPVDSLAKALEDAGSKLDRATLSASKETVGGQLDKDAFKKDGTVAHNFNAQELRNSGVDVDSMLGAGTAQANGKNSIRIVQHQGLQSQKSSGRGIKPEDFV